MSQTATTSSDSNLQAPTSAFSGKVPAKIKGAYALGASAETIFSVAFNSFNFFFYTNLMGLSGTLAGLAITIGLFVDAITDPLVGAISDRWRSKLGRRHPFMFLSPIPVMVCIFLLYSPPENMSQLGLFAWLATTAVVMRSFFTLFHVPHLALGAELSSDFYERSKIMSLNTLCTAIGAALVLFMGLSFFFKSTPEFSNGLMNVDAYPLFALTAATLGGVVMLASAYFTRSVIPKLPQPPQHVAKFSLTSFIADLKDAFSNRNYRVLLIGYLFLSATLGTRETISMHMSTYYWELTTEQIRFYALALLLGPILGFLFTTTLHRLFDKKPSLVGALFVFTLLVITPVSCRILGIFPENHSPNLFKLLFLFYLLICAAGTVMLITAMSMLADIADEHEINTHRRQEGIFYAARSFFAKASSGLGHLIAGIALDLIDFPVGAKPGTVDPDTVHLLGLVDGPLAGIPVAISLIFYLQYRLTRSHHKEIQSTLQRRHASISG